MRLLLLLIIPLLMISCASKKTKSGDAGSAAKSGSSKAASKSSGSSSSASTGTIADAVICKVGKDERQIAKKMTDGGGCEVVYTKHGETNVIADAKNDASYCDNVVEKIKTNLTNAGFNCN